MPEATESSPISKIAQPPLRTRKKPHNKAIPKTIINRGGCNLSFAGLKTAFYKSSKLIKNNQDKYDLAASFQKTIIDIIYKKTKIALNEFKKYYNNNT